MEGNGLRELLEALAVRLGDEEARLRQLEVSFASREAATLRGRGDVTDLRKHCEECHGRVKCTDDDRAYKVLEGKVARLESGGVVGFPFLLRNVDGMLRKHPEWVDLHRRVDGVMAKAWKEVLSALRKDMEGYPLYQLDTMALPHDTSSSQMLWQTAGYLVGRHSRPLDEVTRVLLLPFLVAFRTHFEGSAPTNRREKPEWVLKFAKGVLRNHWDLARRVILPAAPELEECLVGFFGTVLDTVGVKVVGDDVDDALFQHTMLAVLSFDEEMAAILPPSLPLLASRLPPSVLSRWVGAEKQYLNHILSETVWSDRCWESHLPSLREVDDHRVGMGAYFLSSALHSLVRKLNIIPAASDDVASQLIVPAIERFISRSEELTLPAAEAHPVTVVVACNSLSLMSSAIDSWLLLPSLSHSVAVFSPVSDALNVAQEILVKQVAMDCVAPITAFIRDGCEAILKGAGTTALATPYHEYYKRMKAVHGAAHTKVWPHVVACTLRMIEEAMKRMLLAKAFLEREEGVGSPLRHAAILQAVVASCTTLAEALEDLSGCGLDIPSLLPALLDINRAVALSLSPDAAQLSESITTPASLRPLGFTVLTPQQVLLILVGHADEGEGADRALGGVVGSGVVHGVKAISDSEVGKAGRSLLSKLGGQAAWGWRRSSEGGVPQQS